MSKKFENQDLEMLIGIIDNNNRFEHQRLDTVLDYLCEHQRQRLITKLGLIELKNQELEKSNSFTIEIDKVKITINR